MEVGKSIMDNHTILGQNATHQIQDSFSGIHQSKLTNKHFQFSPDKDIVDIEDINDVHRDEKKILLDHVEDDGFKSKRAAHYNEFKLGRISMTLSISCIFFSMISIFFNSKYENPYVITTSLSEVYAFLHYKY